MELYQLRQFAAVAKIRKYDARRREPERGAARCIQNHTESGKRAGSRVIRANGKGITPHRAGEISCCGTHGRYWKPSATRAAKSRRACTGQAVCASVRCRARSVSVRYSRVFRRVRQSGSAHQQHARGQRPLLDSAVSRDEVPAGAVLLYDEEMCVAVPEGTPVCRSGKRIADRTCRRPVYRAEQFAVVPADFPEHIFRSAGMEMHAAIECDSAALQIRLLSCGMGVALVASGEWRQVCEDAGVRLLHIKDAQCRRYIYVQTLGRFRTQSIRAFTAYLERYFCADGVNPRQVMRRVPRENFFTEFKLMQAFERALNHIEYRLIGEERNMRGRR